MLVIYEGEIVAEMPPTSSEEDFGARDDRRRTRRGRRRERSLDEEFELPPDATVAARLATYLRGGGIITPLITVLLAFLVGGLVVLITGHDPIATYKAIFNGTGLNWFFPWVSGTDRTIAALNLQQTLIQTTPLILTGLAVAFAFRCGLFNIGGQGQYLVGSFVGDLDRHVVQGHAGLRSTSCFALVGACAGRRRVGRRSPAR